MHLRSQCWEGTVTGIPGARWLVSERGCIKQWEMFKTLTISSDFHIHPCVYTDTFSRGLNTSIKEGVLRKKTLHSQDIKTKLVKNSECFPSPLLALQRILIEPVS